eukprot:8082745-Ditylum_brightwellii.AAC.1
MEQKEYMKLPIELIPEEIIAQYNLKEKTRKGWVYIRIEKGMYRLPQAGILANKQLTKKKDVEHLLNAIQTHYDVSEDWMGSLYCGITFTWNYKEGWVEISIPGYVQKALMKFQHPPPKRPQYAPYKHNLPKYGAKQQMVEVEQELPKLSAEGKWQVQQVVGTLLFYNRQVDLTMFTALSSIAAEQNNSTANTAQSVAMLLDYAATNPDAKIRFRAAGYFYLEEEKVDKINGLVLVLAKILKCVMASTAKAECGSLHENGRETIPLQMALE